MPYHDRLRRSHSRPSGRASRGWSLSVPVVVGGVCPRTRVGQRHKGGQASKIPITSFDCLLVMGRGILESLALNSMALGSSVLGSEFLADRFSSDQLSFTFLLGGLSSLLVLGAVRLGNRRRVADGSSGRFERVSMLSPGLASPVE